MISLPSRNGYSVGWETGEISKRTGNPIMNYYEDRSREKVEAKQQEMIKKGYKVTKITECIF